MKKAAVCWCLAVLLILLSACDMIPAQEQPAAVTEEAFTADFTIRAQESATAVYYDVPQNWETTDGAGPVTTTLPPADHTLSYEALRSLMTQSMFSGGASFAKLWSTEICYAFDGAFKQSDRDELAAMANDLMQIAAFHGIRETQIDAANVLVRLDDVPTASCQFETSANGTIVSGEITIPSSVRGEARKALLVEKMFRLFGFPEGTDTALESVLAPEPAPYITEADLVLLEAVYTQFTPGMDKHDCMNAFAQYFLQGDP